MLEQMVGAFDDQASSLGLTAAAARLHLTPYQVVTVASIVEREAKLAADRGRSPASCTTACGPGCRSAPTPPRPTTCA